MSHAEKQLHAIVDAWEALPGVDTPSPQNTVDIDEQAAIDLGAAVLARIEDPDAREIAIRNALSIAAAVKYKSPSVDRAASEDVFAQLILIKQLATDTTERNWADKRLYIAQAADRAIAEAKGSGQ